MSALLTDLDEHLLDALAPPDAPSDEDVETESIGNSGSEGADRVNAWEPTDAGSADWVARKAQKAAADLAALQEQHDRLVAQAGAWLQREKERPARKLAWAESMLRLWLDAEIDADDSKKPRKSRELPCGVKVRQTPAGTSLTVEDEEALVAWLQSEEPDAVEFVAKYSKATVKKLVTGDGLAVPGVKLVQGTVGFKLEVDA